MESSRFTNSELIEKSDPKVFQKYTIHKILTSTNAVSIFEGKNNYNEDRMSFCISKAKLPTWIREVVHIQQSPKLHIYLTPAYTVAVEDAPDASLDRLLDSLEPDEPFLTQQQTARIMRQVSRNYVELKEKNVMHSNITTKAIVCYAGKWKIDLFPAIADIDGSNKMFYPRGPEKNERAEVFALGVILFRCLFGFLPFQDVYTENFRVADYLDLLNQKTIEGSAKIFYFLKAKLNLSDVALNLLELALSSQSCRIEDFANHPFFNNLERYSRNKPVPLNVGANDQIRMIGSVQKRQLSKAMAAIDKYTHKKTPLVSKYQLVNTLKSPEEVFAMFREDFHLSRFQISKNFIAYQEPQLVQSRYDKSASSPTRNYLYGKLYFGNEVSQLEDEYPCRELLKYIDVNSKRNGFSDQSVLQRLLMYAYPHAIAFQLLKDRPNQSSDIQTRIDTVSDLLFDLCNINYPRSLAPQPALQNHHEVPANAYQQMKPRFREKIHFLYKHYLNSAIHKYNSSKRDLAENPQSQLALRSKGQGLNYYRLCWKLLEASLINRKQGADLNIGRIETGERKEIQIGINSLLAKYFPNKLY